MRIKIFMDRAPYAVRVTPSQRKSLLLQSIAESEKRGSSMGDIMKYFNDKGILPVRGEKRSIIKISIIDDVSDFENNREIFPYMGRYFLSKYKVEELELPKAS